MSLDVDDLALSYNYGGQRTLFPSSSCYLCLKCFGSACICSVRTTSPLCRQLLALAIFARPRALPTCRIPPSDLRSDSAAEPLVDGQAFSTDACCCPHPPVSLSVVDYNISPLTMVNYVQTVCNRAYEQPGHIVCYYQKPNKNVC